MKRSPLLLLVIVLSAVSTVSYSQVRITIAGLRSSGSPSNVYFITDPGREGIFYHDSKDITSADNGGTIIVSGANRFKRQYSGAIDGRWFGMAGDYNGTRGTDNTDALNAAINAAYKGQTLLIPHGQYWMNSSITLPLARAKKVVLEIYGDIYFARGAGFVIEGDNQEFRSYGLIAGGNAGATTESEYAAYSGNGLYLRNLMNSRIEVNEIKDFKNGILMAGERTGGPEGCQYNRITFSSIHHNHTQIKITTGGESGTDGNWNNSSFWYGGQVGRGTPLVTYGKGGWYGIVFHKESGSNAKDPMNGHVFNEVGFEGIEKALVMDNAQNNTFIGGRMEPFGSRYAVDLDPATCLSTKFIGMAHLEEGQFVEGRLGSRTIISGTPLWSGTTTQELMGYQAMNSINSDKLLVLTNKYTPTNFLVNKTHDLISQTGQYPTVQAMMYRINDVVRSVPYKGTFFHVTPSVSENSITLPPNISAVRVEATQAKEFKIDQGDMAIYGESFIVEYLSPAYPIKFLRASDNKEIIPSSAFPSGGIYRCVWADGQYKVSKMGAEFKTFTQTGPRYTIGDGIETHYVNYPYTHAECTLPDAAKWPGRVIVIKNLQAAYNVQVTGIAPSDDNMIAGRGAITVKSDGEYWNVIGFYKRGFTY